jgi:hypothetical protein
MGSASIIPRDSISLSVTFGTPANYRTESVVFDVVEINLSFNAIISRPALYQFMVVAHYGYMVLKMSSPNGVIKIRGDRITGAFTLEKLQALATTQEDVVGFGESDQAPSSSCQRILSFAPCVQPSNNEDIPVKVIQISVDAVQTTHIAGNLGDK